MIAVHADFCRVSPFPMGRRCIVDYLLGNSVFELLTALLSLVFHQDKRSRITGV